MPENTNEFFYCPCCGYHGLSEPAYSKLPSPPFNDLGDPPYIERFGYPSYGCCDCCGFESGYDDDAGASGQARSFSQYLNQWIRDGMKWFRPNRCPDGWSLERQLKTSGIHRDHFLDDYHFPELSLLVGKIVCHTTTDTDTGATSEEFGIIIHAWRDETLDSVDCYVAFFGYQLPQPGCKPPTKPYVLRYLLSSLKICS